MSLFKRGNLYRAYVDRRPSGTTSPPERHVAAQEEVLKTAKHQLQKLEDAKHGVCQRASSFSIQGETTHAKHAPETDRPHA